MSVLGWVWPARMSMATWDNLDLELAGWCKVMGGSRDVPGCPMATWDNSDLGLVGWCKVMGGSQDVPGCPMATWDNSDLGLAVR